MARAQSKKNGLLIDFNEFTRTAVELGQGKFAEVTNNPRPSEYYLPEEDETAGDNLTPEETPEATKPKSGKGKKALPKEPAETPEAEAEQPEEL